MLLSTPSLLLSYIPISFRLLVSAGFVSPNLLMLIQEWIYLPTCILVLYLSRVIGKVCTDEKGCVISREYDDDERCRIEIVCGQTTSNLCSFFLIQDRFVIDTDIIDVPTVVILFLIDIHLRRREVNRMLDNYYLVAISSFLG